jgi:predicted acetyltransferase
MELVDPFNIDEREFKDFIDEFEAAGEDLVPYSLNQKGLDFEAYVASLNDESLGKGLSEGWVPASTYFLLDDEGRICGAVNIRHRLTENLRIEGGHVGYGIRPSARNRGYGTKILELALGIVREMGIKQVLVTCDRGNASSARVIQKNGGQLDSEIEKGDRVVQRYWIEV